MNMVKEVTEKYNGKYAEGITKSAHTPIGKYVYMPKKGIIEVDGTTISIHLNEAGGVADDELFLIILHLDQNYDTKLTVFPKDLWNKFVNFIRPNRNAFFPKPILKQFWFGGNEALLQELASDAIFMENLINQRIYIETGDRPTNRIALTLEHGLKDHHEFEKVVSILKQIENKIKTLHRAATLYNI